MRARFDLVREVVVKAKINGNLFRMFLLQLLQQFDVFFLPIAENDKLRTALDDLLDAPGEQIESLLVRKPRDHAEERTTFGVRNVHRKAEIFHALFLAGQIIDRKWPYQIHVL